MTIIYVDGACKGNPGLGGWGVWIQFAAGNTLELCGGELNTTNNRMELTAAIQALEHTPPDTAVTIWTDSSYVQQGISNWIHGWKKKGWRKADGKPVINADLWKQLDTASTGRAIEWKWVKGHAGIEGNEKADQLANLGCGKAQANPLGKTESSSIAMLDDNTLHADPVIAIAITRTVDLSMDNTSNNTPSSASTPNLASVNRQPDTNPTDWLTTDPLGLDVLDEDYDVHYAGDDDGYEPNYDEGYSAADEPQPYYTPTPTPTPTATPSISQPTFETIEDVSQLQITPATLMASGKRQLILDTETTGLNADDRVIEIGIIEVIGRKITGSSFHVYINPLKAVGDSEAIHGISDVFLQDKPLFSHIAQPLIDYIAGDEIVAHNSSFDMRFLDAELGRIKHNKLSSQCTVVDSFAIARQKHPTQKNSLDALVKRYEVTVRDRTYHGALLDAQILADVYLKMTGGQITLGIDADNGHSEQGSFTHEKLEFNNRPLVIHATSNDVSAHQAWLTGQKKADHFAYQTAVETVETAAANAG